MNIVWFTITFDQSGKRHYMYAQIISGISLSIHLQMIFVYEKIISWLNQSMCDVREHDIWEWNFSKESPNWNEHVMAIKKEKKKKKYMIKASFFRALDILRMSFESYQQNQRVHLSEQWQFANHGTF